jgi:hypothetical protein
LAFSFRSGGSRRSKKKNDTRRLVSKELKCNEERGVQFTLIIGCRKSSGKRRDISLGKERIISEAKTFLPKDISVQIRNLESKKSIL